MWCGDLKLKTSTQEWQATCGKCYGVYKSFIKSDENPHPHGVFCPNCISEKSGMSGVLNFKKVKNL